MTIARASANDLFKQVLDPVNRSNPYRIYEQMLANPVAQLDATRYVVTTYNEIIGLLHDPRASKDERKSKAQGTSLRDDSNPSLLFLDAPEHDQLRKLVIHQFTPERISGMQGRISSLVTEALDALRGQTQFDFVEKFAYPLPVTVICELMGVPREDEQRFHAWADMLAHNIEPVVGYDPAKKTAIQNADKELHTYMSELVKEKRAHPQDDLVSGLAVGNDPAGQMSDKDLITTLVLLLVAGHETTVNLLSNSMLTLLRHPFEWRKLHEQPERVMPVVEEVLRYEPPVQFMPRYALNDITLQGVTISQGSTIELLYAAGNRDPRHFPHPNDFNPERPNNQHFGFGGGDHLCIGAPLARIEVHTALNELARRLINPRLLADPPPYKSNPVLRGPQHLPLAFDRIAD
ncbi:putative cytochrome P450 [Ktedonobacteria bacterium brp13]|nr:putative cytochrome P450 [Ktedonobacteria bacterium brp13]